MAWLRSGSSRNNGTSELVSSLSDPLPLIDSDIPVFDNETNAFNDTDEIRLNPSEIDPLDNFHNASALPDEEIVDHNVELRNLSSTVEDEVTLVNDSPAEITTMSSIPTTLRTIKLITNTWYPSTQPITTLKPETLDDEIREITIDPQVTTMKSEETTLAVESVNTVRQPRKPRVHENKTESIESSSTIGSIPEMPTQRVTKAPKIVEKTTQLPTTTQVPTTTQKPAPTPPASLLEALANLTASHGDFRKARQDYDYMPQPVYIPEIHGNEREIEEPQFEFHSELAKALGVHHNVKKTSPGKVNNFL